MKIGQSIPLQVLRVSTNDSGKDGTGSRQLLAGLKVGQYIKAAVVGVFENGLMQMETEGHTIAARSNVKFHAGSEIWLEVHDEGPPPVLSVATRKMAIQDLLKFYFVNTGRISHSLSDLDTFFTAQNLGGGSGASGLNEFWQLLNGITLGSKTDPAKILQMVHAFSQIGRVDGFGRPEGTLRDRFGLADNVELGRDELDALLKIGKLFEVIQSVNRLASGDEQVDCSLFPCVFSSSAGWGQWIFSADKKEREAENEPRYILDFFLDMSRIGETHISIEVGPGSISGTFLVEREDVKTFVNSNLSELSETLSDYGYKDISLSCHMAERKIRQLFKETIEEKASCQNVSLVNVKV